jgi:hypothetical protein
MRWRTEVAHSRYLLEKAEARLAFEKRRLIQLSLAPGIADLESAIVAAMESRLSGIRRNHDQLMGRIEQEAVSPVQ